MRRLAPLAVALAIPILAAGLAMVARAQWDDRWSAGLQREFLLHGRSASAPVMERYSLAALCADARTAARVPPCRTYNTFATVILVAGATATAGLLLLGGIAAAGAAARRNRHALLAGFRPALYTTTAALVGLLLAHALLGLQVVRLLAVVAGVPSGGLLTFLGAIAIVLVAGGAASAVGLARQVRAPRRVLAARLEPARLSGWLAAAEWPVIAGLVPEVFVAPAGAITADGALAGPALHVPLTLASILTGPELEALSRRARSRAAQDDGAAARLVEGWSGVSAGHAGLRRAGGLRLFFGLPVLWVVGMLLEVYAQAEAALERQQQLAADRAAAEAGDPRTCGVATLKAAAFGPAWLAAVRLLRDALREGSEYPNAREVFTSVAAANADETRVAAVIHPDAATAPGSVPVRQRLERLGLVPETLVADALDVPPTEPALALAGPGIEEVERRLTSIVHAQLLGAR